MKHWIATWPFDEVPDVEEGAWVAVVCDETDVDAVGLRLRSAGIEIRDCINILSKSSVLAVIGRRGATETYAELEIRCGMGALDIDVCRIPTGEKLTGGGGKLWSHYRDGTQDRAEARVNDGDGRWPSNTVLVHDDSCEMRGVRKVRNTDARSGEITDTFARSWKNSSTEGIARTGYGSEDGREEVPDWRCSEECPAPELDGQSGVTRSGKSAKWHDAYDGESRTGFLRGWSNPDSQYDDEGGASRFFHQFVDEDELFGFLEALIGRGG